MTTAPTAAGGRGLGSEKISLRLTGDKIVILSGVLPRLVNTELAEIERTAECHVRVSANTSNTLILIGKKVVPKDFQHLKVDE